MTIADAAPTCGRCARGLSAEKPVRLPDSRSYCAACCERMATDAFEMETGEPFVKWIEKHPVLVMKHQPMELYLRRIGFLSAAGLCLLGILVAGYGVYRLAGGGVSAGPETDGTREALGMDLKEWLTRENRLAATAGILCLAAGPLMAAGFAWVAFRQGTSFLRARGFKLTLKDGVFYLEHGERRENFQAGDVTQACVVRPGTVGATEGALGLGDGRMLTLDSCLTDLHALGVVMDLRFREDFPPSAEDLERQRRERLRKIRGLS